ncbi:MAG: mechanosensitive ion channel family protein [Alsobacter sp.]
MAWIRRLLIACMLVACAGTVWAQQATPPAGLSREQFDALVEAISKSVVEKIKAAPAPDTAGAKTAVAVSNAPSGADDLEARVGAFLERAGTVAVALPQFVSELARIPKLLDQSGQGGRGTLMFLIILLCSAAAALAAELAVRRLFDGARHRMSAEAEQRSGLRAVPLVILIALVDVVALGAVWLVSYGAAGAFFHGTDGQSKLAALVLTGLFAWRLYMLAFRIALRPGLPGARLAAMGNDEAWLVYRRISAVILVIVGLRIILRVLIAIKADSAGISFGQVLVALTIFAAFMWAVQSCRSAVGDWFADLGRVEGRVSLGEWAGRNWTIFAVPFFAVLTLAQIYGAIALRFSIPAAMLLTLNVVIALILLETLSDFLTRRIGGHVVAARTARPARLSDVVARCVRIAAFIGAATIVAQTWIVDVFALVDQSGWQQLTRRSVTAGMTLFLAFVGWELVKFFTNRYAAANGAGGAGGPVDEDAAHPGGASRLATMMPLLRIALAIVITIVALLIVLSELGVNITPLIAGASVFGLAISFGSQTLVRDIVSGIFYLADDAFRVGEYIDCGKAKGTVEGFTLRSIKLRHQNGQVHTIPFGQLGQITNFSRDWATLKFNLRFARDTDLEKLRKLTKKIGQEMLEDPELKDEFIEPLKMQGVADILDNAIVVRFKFTVKPSKPTFVQRQAVKRMVASFAANGIEFASATVSVQTVGGGDPAAAAAAQSIAARSQAAANAAMVPTG